MGSYLRSVTTTGYCLLRRYAESLARGVPNIGFLEYKADGSPSAGEVGPFRAIEESILTQLTPLAERSDIMSWCSFLGILGQALGIVVCGWVVEVLEKKPHWSRLRAYRVIFLTYAVLGFVKLCLTLILSKDCEAKERKKDYLADGEAAEETRLLDSDPKDPKRPARSWTGARLQRESYIMLAKICSLQFLEAISVGLIVK